MEPHPEAQLPEPLRARYMARAHEVRAPAGYTWTMLKNSRADWAREWGDYLEKRVVYPRLAHGHQGGKAVVVQAIRKMEWTRTMEEVEVALDLLVEERLATEGNCQVFLAVVQGASYSELVESLGLSADTLHQRVRRARKALLASGLLSSTSQRLLGLKARKCSSLPGRAKLGA